MYCFIRFRLMTIFLVVNIVSCHNEFEYRCLFTEYCIQLKYSLNKEIAANSNLDPIVVWTYTSKVNKLPCSWYLLEKTLVNCTWYRTQLNRPLSVSFLSFLSLYFLYCFSPFLLFVLVFLYWLTRPSSHASRRQHLPWTCSFVALEWREDQRKNIQEKY